MGDAAQASVSSRTRTGVSPWDSTSARPGRDAGTRRARSGRPRRRPPRRAAGRPVAPGEQPGRGKGAPRPVPRTRGRRPPEGAVALDSTRPRLPAQRGLAGQDVAREGRHRAQRLQRSPAGEPYGGDATSRGEHAALITLDLPDPLPPTTATTSPREARPTTLRRPRRQPTKGMCSRQRTSQVGAARRHAPATSPRVGAHRAPPSSARRGSWVARRSAVGPRPRSAACEGESARERPCPDGPSDSTSRLGSAPAPGRSAPAPAEAGLARRIGA